MQKLWFQPWQWPASEMGPKPGPPRRRPARAWRSSCCSLGTTPLPPSGSRPPVAPGPLLQPPPFPAAWSICPRKTLPGDLQASWGGCSQHLQPAGILTARSPSHPLLLPGPLHEGLTAARPPQMPELGHLRQLPHLRGQAPVASRKAWPTAPSWGTTAPCRTLPGAGLAASVSSLRPGGRTIPKAACQDLQKIPERRSQGALLSVSPVLPPRGPTPQESPRAPLPGLTFPPQMAQGQKEALGLTIQPRTAGEPHPTAAPAGGPLALPPQTPQATGKARVSLLCPPTLPHGG